MYRIVAFCVYLFYFGFWFLVFYKFVFIFLQIPLREFQIKSLFMGQQSPVGTPMKETLPHCNALFCPPFKTIYVMQKTFFIGTRLTKISHFQASSMSVERNTVNATTRAASITSQRTSALTTLGLITAVWPLVGRFYLVMEPDWMLLML